jgi:hypothetical protein
MAFSPLTAEAILQGKRCVDPSADTLTTGEVITSWNNRSVILLN